MTEDQKEIVELMTKWKDEVKQLTVDYKEAVQKLDASRTTFEKSKDGYYARNRVWISPIIWVMGIILVLIVLNAIVKQSDWCSTSFSGIEITRSCAR